MIFRWGVEKLWDFWGSDFGWANKRVIIIPRKGARWLCLNGR
jgi:hypothetical protein